MRSTKARIIERQMITNIIIMYKCPYCGNVYTNAYVRTGVDESENIKELCKSCRNWFLVNVKYNPEAGDE